LPGIKAEVEHVVEAPSEMREYGSSPFH
jgi:hypothetical protein